jgi:hypothetical protein
MKYMRWVLGVGEERCHVPLMFKQNAKLQTQNR